MIALKDIPVLLSLGGVVFGGGVAYHGVKTDIAELSADYRAHVAEQQETTLMERKWRLEDRLRTRPDDEQLRRDLDEVYRQLDRNQKQQREIKGGK